MTTARAASSHRAAAATPAALARRVRGLSDRAIAWLFISPTILLLLAINIFPLVWTIRLSFTNYRANRPNAAVRGVGIDNYVVDPHRPRRVGGDAGHRAFRVLDHPRCRRCSASALAWLIDRALPRPRLLDHGDPDPDDAVAGGGRELLDLPLPAADRAVELRGRPSSPASPPSSLQHDRRRSRWRPGRSSSSTPGCGRPT